MTISESFWKKYAQKLTEIDQRASQEMRYFIQYYGLEDDGALISYAYQIVQKYGSASSELACEMYELLADFANQVIPSAIPAELANYGEVAKVVMGSLKDNFTGEAIPGAVSRLVKQASADTMIQNAARDHAQWAWIPVGDTCAFCITLASQGWVYASQDVKEGYHAEHIHENCDCTFAVRFRESDEIEGYDPHKYWEMYEYEHTPDGKMIYDENGEPVRRKGSSKDRINAMRREFYQQNRERILAQKRSARERRNALNSGKAEETMV